jgi:hypothetical protein
MQRGSLRWCAAQLKVSHSHLIRVRDGQRPNVNRLLERFERLQRAQAHSPMRATKGTR